MNYGWKLSNSITALYGASVVGLLALLMHAWQDSLSAEALARVISAVAVLAFHTLALLTLGLLSVPSKFNALVIALWHLGLWGFVWTVLAGVFQLPVHISALAPIGGQLLIVAWLLLAVSIWRRS